ncbi:MAG TPA: phage replisome organizer N-terminal domain-containing protein [Faecalibacterium prausnitzii]|nr:phage replisome organizer N-terminal domain-containing protein [Faecalibacterium prausnitzii]
MATGKRYYWIKLKDSFMSSDAIDYLMSQPDGANYVVLYQMLCLKTINTGGCLVSKIGEMLIPYDVEKIQRECKWFSLATVRVALEVYKQIGLVFENPDGTLSISDYSEMIGSETDWAAKKRRQTLQAANSPLSIGESGRDTTGENLPIEKEIDKDKEKDKEIRPRSTASSSMVPEYL